MEPEPKPGAYRKETASATLFTTFPASGRCLLTTQQFRNLPSILLAYFSSFINNLFTSYAVCQTPLRPNALGPARQQSLDTQPGPARPGPARQQSLDTRPGPVRLPLDQRPGPVRQQLSLDTRPRLASSHRRQRISVDLEDLASPTSTGSRSSSMVRFSTFLLLF